MIAKAIYEKLNASIGVTVNLSTYEFTTGVFSPAIFTNYKFLDDSARPAIMIDEVGAVQGGTRGQKGGDDEAEIRILGNKNTSDQVLNNIARAVWDTLDRAELSVEAFDSLGVYAEFPRRIVDGDGFPGYAVSLRAILYNNTPLTPTAPLYQSNPTISGDQTEGSILTAIPGSLTGFPAPMESFAWYRGIDIIPGEIGLNYTIVAADLGEEITFQSTATNGVNPDAVATSNAILAGVAPTFDTQPTISGTPEPGEDITAIDGTASGIPTPTIDKEFYLDGAQTGITATIYTVQPGDVGKTLDRRNVAINGVAPNASADSNSLEIVSGFVGALDGITTIFKGSPTQPLTSVYSSGGLNSVAVRNGTTGIPSEIGYVNNKIDEAGWDAASANGTQILYVTSLLNQGGTPNAIQAITGQQPILLRTGEMVWDGVNDSLRFNGTVTGDYSLIFDGSVSSYANDFTFMGYNPLSVGFKYLQSVDSVYFQLALTNVSLPFAAIPNFSTLKPVGSDFQIVASYEESVALRLYLDGSLISTTPIALPKFGDELYFDIGSVNDGLSGVFNGKSKFPAITELLTDQQVLDIYTQWSLNDA